MTRTASLGLRIVALALVLFVVLPVAAALTGVASAEAPKTGASTPESSAGTAFLALTAFCLLTAAVCSWLIARSTLFGWRLAGALFLVYFGLGTFMLQVESVIFLPRQLPPGFVTRLFAMGALIGLVFAPAAVWIHGRRRPPVAAPPGTTSGLHLSSGEWAVRLGWLAAAYVALYFLAGYYIAYSNPDVVAYYDDVRADNFVAGMQRVWVSMPWLFAVQALRGLLWVAFVLPFIVSFQGRSWELPLLVGCTYGVWLVTLFAPNPYMPESVRMSHFVETGSSNFVFGCLVGASFVRARRAKPDRAPAAPIAPIPA
jgi:hypothetical protein